VVRALFRLAAGCGLVACVSLSTRGQTDMRGLVTAGRAVRLERFRLSRVERRPQGGLLIADPRVAPRAAVTAATADRSEGRLSRA
jgi:hypothetical protein